MRAGKLLKQLENKKGENEKMTNVHTESGAMKVSGYISGDIMSSMHLLSIFGGEEIVSMPKIKDVKFFDKKVTVVYWTDGDVTRSKIGKGDVFNEEYGLAMCIAKKYRGSYEKFAMSLAKAKHFENGLKVKKVKTLPTVAQVVAHNNKTNK